MPGDLDLPLVDRTAAGRALGALVAAMHLPDPLVLALPRGGVPVGLEVARALKAPLDLLLVRKIGVPFQRELAVAAVLEGAEPVIVVDEPIRAEAGVPQSYIDEQTRIELAEIGRRRRAYLGDRLPLPITARTVIVVDDGIATGTTARAAIKGLRRRDPARIVLAVPVAPRDTAARLRVEVDDLVCLAQPDLFGAIGLFYVDFHQLSDEEVVQALQYAP
ncbi:MAG TPA: phosphoribosyltransferase family protein [Burkholderiaceae bacterium]|jgi:putative phosphoribosyl transferase